MKVLSLFDGMSCGMLALERAGIKVDAYCASEIDKYAIQVSEKNYPNIVRLGDVNNWREWNLGEIDLIIGGSPCQGFSFAGKQLAFDDPRSKLFFTMVDIINHYKPKYFLLENVKMKKEFQDVITEYMGVQPIEINSALVSAQNRKRLYWTNIHGIEQPKDKGIFLKDTLEDNVDDRYYLSENQYKWLKDYGSKSSFGGKINTDKSSCILASYGKVSGNGGKIRDKKGIRMFTEIECERLQTVPDNYTSLVSNSQRYKMLGNGWTIDVISHILKHIK